MGKVYARARASISACVSKLKYDASTPVVAPGAQPDATWRNQWALRAGSMRGFVVRTLVPWVASWSRTPTKLQYEPRVDTSARS